jgi:predicted ATP-grasp superfamily ATP-dependent carboligase
VGLASSSRGVAASHEIVSSADPDGFVASLNEAVAAGGYSVVLPGGGDLDALTLSAQRDRINAVIPYGPHDGLVTAFDKSKLNHLAGKVGLQVPRTVPAGRVPDGWRTPLVLKARLHSPPHEGGSPAHLPTSVHDDRGALALAAEEMRRRGGEPLVQELVDGSLVALSTVTDRDSLVLARAQQVSDGLWPPGAGVSSRAHTVEVDTELAHRVQELLGLVGWFGVAQLQFIHSAERGYTLIDFNGRFYGSLPLAIAAGARLPALWAAEALGAVGPPTRDAAPGVTFQWLRTDLRRARRERRGGLVADVTGCFRAAARRGTAHCVWSRSDPRPSLRAMADLAARARSAMGSSGHAS